MQKIVDKSLKMNVMFIYLKISPHIVLIYFKGKKDNSVKEKLGRNHLNQEIKITSNTSN